MFLLDQLSFPKSGEQIIEKAKAKLARLTARQDERNKTVAALAQQLGIESVEEALTRADELDNSLASPEDSVAHSKLQGLASRAKRVREEILQLEMVVRNLPHGKTFDLKFEALKYFGF
jgi:hypothetical protein